MEPALSPTLIRDRSDDGPGGQIPDLHLRRDLRWATLITWRFLKRHRIKSSLTLALVLSVVIFGTFPNDRALFEVIRGDKDPEVREIAQAIGKTGSLAQYNVVIVFGVWMIGFLRRSRYLQRLAVMIFVSTVLAGLTCNVFRVTMGRPRPFTNVDPSQFQGLQFQARYHGFPSGHTSTAFGTAVPFFTVMPGIGAPVLIYAGAMGWARIYDKAHYPSDVLVGAYLGTLFGIAGGMPLVRARNRAKRLKRFREQSA